MTFVVTHSAFTNCSKIHSATCPIVATRKSGEVHERFDYIFVEAVVNALEANETTDRKITICKCAK